MKNSKGISSVIISFTGSLLSLAALLIYIIIPTSQLANGIEHSGTDALWVLALAPAGALVGSALFLFSFLKDYRQWVDTMSKPLIIGMATLLGCMSLFNVALYLSYFIAQCELGFVAPYTGLVYDVLRPAAVAVTVTHFIFSVICTIGALRKSK